MTIVPFGTQREVGAAILLAREHLARGGLLGHPTETVYGVGGRVTEGAVTAVTALKGRGEGKPMLVLVDGLSMIERLGLRVEGPARALAEAFWPGPLTLVLPGGNPSIPSLLRGPSGGVAVRWTSHPGMRALLAACGEPITSSSANVAGGRTATAASDLAALFGEAAAERLLVLDGGVLPGAPSSTVVDCAAGGALVAREGAVPRHAIASVIGSLTS